MSVALRMKHDDEGDALYLTLREGTAAETIEIEESVYVDLDDDGRPLGIEFIGGADFLPFLRRQGGEFVVPGLLREPTSVTGR